MQQGELDECDLSLTDLDTVRESFVNTLKGFFHSRLQYPKAQHPPIPVNNLEEAEKLDLPTPD